MLPIRRDRVADETEGIDKAAELFRQGDRMGNKEIKQHVIHMKSEIFATVN